MPLPSASSPSIAPAGKEISLTRLGYLPKSAIFRTNPKSPGGAVKRYPIQVTVKRSRHLDDGSGNRVDLGDFVAVQDCKQVATIVVGDAVHRAELMWPVPEWAQRPMITSIRSSILPMKG